MIKTTEGLFPAQRLVRRDDPETSHIAAQKVVESGLQKSHHEKILAVLSKRQNYAEGVIGWCAKEVASEMNNGQHWSLVYYAVARRLNELVKGGDIYVAEKERVSMVGGGKCQAYRKK